MPLDNKKVRLVRNVKDREVICLTEEQRRHIYKKVELGSEINIGTMKQEIDNDELTRTKTNEEEEINPYQKVVFNNVCRDKTKRV